MSLESEKTTKNRMPEVGGIHQAYLRFKRSILVSFLLCGDSSDRVRNALSKSCCNRAFSFPCVIESPVDTTAAAATELLAIAGTRDGSTLLEKRIDSIIVL